MKACDSSQARCSSTIPQAEAVIRRCCSDSSIRWSSILDIVARHGAGHLHGPPPWRQTRRQVARMAIKPCGRASTSRFAPRKVADQLPTSLRARDIKKCATGELPSSTVPAKWLRLVERSQASWRKCACIPRRGRVEASSASHRLSPYRPASDGRSQVVPPVDPAKTGCTRAAGHIPEAPTPTVPM